MAYLTLLTLSLFGSALASPAAPISQRATGPTVSTGLGQIVGSTAANSGVDTFNGIPFAQPPVGKLRLKSPQPITTSFGTLNAVGQPRSCPQFSQSVDTSNPISSFVTGLSNIPFFQNLNNIGEDCLTLNVQRPSTANSTSKLPVLFWIYGGGFETGSTQSYDATELIQTSVSQKKDIVYVAVNYRVGGFGFLAGKEIKADGSSNLGLLDQRLGLQWVADNIAAFGGDPDKVTIWGESAGAISVFDQMALYGGDNTYKGKKLFRGAIMNSGSMVPAQPVDGPRGQKIYDTVVAAAGCSGSADTLNCLRGVDYTTFLDAVNSVPSILSYSGIALSYLPRPDGVVLTQSPEMLAMSGQYADVPFIIGDQEDEGTLFSLTQSNITTTNDLVNYLSTVVFGDAPRSSIEALVATYPDDITAGSPFGTGIFNNIYPQYKRLAAMQGDFVFTLVRRALLNLAATVKPSTNTYSYLASYQYGFPLLGTYHSTDIAPSYGQNLPSFASSTIQAYYLSFVNSLDPNVNVNGSLPTWPTWKTNNSLVNFRSATNVLISDNFRQASYNVLANNTGQFRV